MINSLLTSNSIQLVPAEVRSVIYQNNDSTGNVYEIYCRLLDRNNITHNDDINLISAQPLNHNYIKIPIVGEIVLLLSAPSGYTSGTKHPQTIYYIDIISLHSNYHTNTLPGVTFAIGGINNQNKNTDNYIELQNNGNTQNKNDYSNIAEQYKDTDFIENENISPLQPYPGDIIYNGRYGQSIRFSSTPKNTSRYSILPNYSKAEGDPITIIRNTKLLQKNINNNYIVEDFNIDDSSIILSSGQELNFKLSSNLLNLIKSKNINSFESDKFGKISQILLTSGRLIFNSKEKEIILSSKGGIGITSENNISIESISDISITSNTKIELGKNANEPIILGNKWKKWSEDFISAIGNITIPTPVGPSSPIKTSPQWVNIEKLKIQLDTILSELVYVCKTKNDTNIGNNILPTNTPLDNNTITQLKEDQSNIADEIINNIELTPQEKSILINKYNTISNIIKYETDIYTNSDIDLSITDIINNANNIDNIVHIKKNI